MCGYNVFDRSCVLPPFRFWRKSNPLCIDFAVFNCIFSAAGRNHTADIFGCAPLGKIPIIYDDISYTVYMGYSVRVERPFQVCLYPFSTNYNDVLLYIVAC